MDENKPVRHEDRSWVRPADAAQQPLPRWVRTFQWVVLRRKEAA